jgi:hypothetical protein
MEIITQLEDSNVANIFCHKYKWTGHGQAQDEPKRIFVSDEFKTLKAITNHSKCETMAVLATSFCWQHTSTYEGWGHMVTFKVSTQALGPHPSSLL